MRYNRAIKKWGESERKRDRERERERSERERERERMWYKQIETNQIHRHFGLLE